MAKHTSHEVRMPDPSKENFVGTIRIRDIEDRVRKPLPPPTRYHRNKSKYRRGNKHATQEDA
jgi:hypothetical protein